MHSKNCLLLRTQLGKIENPGSATADTSLKLTEEELTWLQWSPCVLATPLCLKVFSHKFQMGCHQKMEDTWKRRENCFMCTVEFLRDFCLFNRILSLQWLTQIETDLILYDLLQWQSSVADSFLKKCVILLYRQSNLLLQRHLEMLLQLVT